MAQFEQWFDQDFTEKIEIRHCESVMFTGDDKGAVVGVHLFNGGAAYSGGGTVSGKVIRSDGAEVALTGTISGNAVSVVLLESCLAVPGPIGVYVRLTANSQKATVLSAIYTVQATSTGTIVDPGTIISSVNDLIDDIQEAVASIPSDYSALLAAVAPTFSDTTAYNAGSYVWYSGVLYRFTTAHPAGTWNGLDVDKVIIGEVLGDTTEKTQNLWVWGDQHANGAYVSLRAAQNVNIPAGVYTLSVEAITSALPTDTDGQTVRMQFYKSTTLATANLITNATFVGDGTRQHVTVDFGENDCKMILLLAGKWQSSAYDVQWARIQLEAGTEATAYTPPFSAVDNNLRNRVNPKLATLDQLVSFTNEQKEIIGTDDIYSDIEITAGADYGDGKFWNSQGTNAVLGTATNYYCFAPVSVQPGEQYKATIYEESSAKQHPVLVVDINYKILASYKLGSVGLHAFSFTVPDSGAFILLTTSTAHQSKAHLEIDNPVLSTKLQLLSDGMQDWRGKNVAIIGDSISTNGAYNPETHTTGNVPEIVVGNEDVGKTLSAYVTYYDVYKRVDNVWVPTDLSIGGHTFTDAEIGTEVTFTPANDDIGKMVGKPLTYYTAARKVWWENIADVLHFNPIAVCWSGSSLSSHEGNDLNYKASYAWHDAIIRKCGIRKPGTMTRTPPDVIIVYRGTNDFSHSPYVRIDEEKINAYPGAYPESDYNGTYYDLVRAMQIIVKKLRAVYPNTQIVFATLNVFKRVNYAQYPTNNGYNTLPQYNDAIRRTAESLGCHVIEFDKDGITFENCYSGGYITDDPTMPTHPSDKGHLVMARRAMIDLAKVNGGLTL